MKLGTILYQVQPGRNASLSSDRGCAHLRYRIILRVLYATGLRRSEAARMKLADIDSQRMIIQVRAGKNSRDRELPLNPKLLEALRAHWRACKVKPKVYLFPTRFKTTEEERPVSDKAVWHACR